MKSIEELAEVRREAEEALRAAQRNKETEFRLLINDEKLRIGILMDAKHNPGINALAAAYQAAVAEEDAALDAAAREGTGAPFPIGTKFVQWEHIRWPSRLQRTGRTGVLEAITKDSEHPDNMSAYRVAKLGEFVLRILKKDGTPSKKYERWDTSWRSDKTKPPHGWHLEDVDPNAEEKKS